MFLMKFRLHLFDQNTVKQ